jgi:arylsulfatase A-like enzyme
MNATFPRLLPVLACLAACSAEAPRRPNILVVSIDTLRADHLGCYGYERPTSPAIDAIASQAVVFEDAHSSASWTLPSFASLFTSLYSTTHGCWKVDSRLESEHDTLAEHLRDAGWDTCLVVPHMFLSGQYGLQQGFTHIDDSLVRTAIESNKVVSSPAMTEKAIAWLERKRGSPDDSPFFLWVHYFDPHDLYLPHEGISEQFGTTEEIDLYDGEIRFVDMHVGRLLARAKELFGDEVVVAIVADHGEEFGEHGHKRHGYSLYQEAVHIPFILRAPGFGPARVPDLVSNIDFMPTILELAGVAPRGRMEGRSLVPLLRGESLPARGALSEVRWHDDQDMRCWREEDWKLHEDRSHGKERDELYDLSADPRERTNLLERRDEVLQRLRTGLGHALGVALQLAKLYPQPRRYQPSPGDAARLGALGYAEDAVGGDGK